MHLVSSLLTKTIRSPCGTRLWSAQTAQTAVGATKRLTGKHAVIVVTSTSSPPLPPSQSLSPPTASTASSTVSAPFQTGYSLPDVVLPYLALCAEGVCVDIASPQGGKVLPDPLTEHFLETDRELRECFLHDTTFRALLERTRPVEDFLVTEEDRLREEISRNHVLSASERATIAQETKKRARERNVDLLLFAGGCGCMWDLPFSRPLAILAQRVYERDRGVVAAIGHGAAALLSAKLNNGDLLVRNKLCTATTNEEEFNSQRTALYPVHNQPLIRSVNNGNTQSNASPPLHLLEDLLRMHCGAHFQRRDIFSSHVVVDDRLVTAQNCYSAQEFAGMLVKVLLREEESKGKKYTARDGLSV